MSARRPELEEALDDKQLSELTALRVACPARGWNASDTRVLTELLGRLPTLRSLAIAWAGGPPLEAAALRVLRDACRRRRLPLRLDLALDGQADACAALGGRPTSLTAVLRATRAARLLGAEVRWQVPIVPALVYRLEALFSLARDEGVDPLLAPAWLVHPASEPAEAELDVDRARFLWDFVCYRLLDEERSLAPPERLALYEGLRDTMGEAGPHLPRTARERTVLSADAETGSHWRLATENVSAFAPPVRALDPPAFDRFEPTPTELGDRLADMGGVLADAERALLQWALLRAAATWRGPAPARDRYESVLVIGAYGGEHIGDAAILGGVLLRLHQRYGTTRAVLLSQRPAHTRHLVPMLDTPVTVTVEGHEQAVVRRHLPGTDAVVFAGGPLMDLPKQLVKHLYTVSLARRLGKAFVAEGIGAGPFKRRPSEWVARLLVREAERVSLRTTDDAKARLVRDLDPEVGHDPAFDYLATRKALLSRLPACDEQWVEDLLHDTEGRVTVGLNLRPIRHLFTEGASARGKVAYTRFVETRFEYRLAEAMERFHAASTPAPCFVFFPMNAIQSGLSDLRCAYRIQRLLGRGVDFRVWEADPSIDGVVSLLRRLDVVVAMRFHANIFALSQDRRAIGIDYRPGARDKVRALLGDFGRDEDCCRIDEMTADWLFERLSSVAP